MLNFLVLLPVMLLAIVFLYLVFIFRKIPSIIIPSQIPAKGLEIPTRIRYADSNHTLLRFFLYEDSIKFETIFGNYKYQLSDIEIVCNGISSIMPVLGTGFGYYDEIFFKIKGKPFFQSFKSTQANFGNSENLKQLLKFLNNKKVVLSVELRAFQDSLLP